MAKFLKRVESTGQISPIHTFPSSCESTATKLLFVPLQRIVHTVKQCDLYFYFHFFMCFTNDLYFNKPNGKLLVLISLAHWKHSAVNHSLLAETLSSLGF